MTSIQLFACIGMVTGFFILLRLSPMEFTDGVFRRLTSRPKSLKDEINELTHRKKKSFLRREIADTQNILKMTGREPKFPAICAMSLLLFVVGASAAIMMGNFFLVPVMAVGMMFVPFWFIKLTASYYKKNIAAELETITARTAELKKSAAAREEEMKKHEDEAARLRLACEEKLAGQSELQRDSAHLGDEIAARKSTLAGFTAERETTERALGDLETLAQQMRGDEDGRRALIEDYRAKIKAAEEEIAQHDAVTASLRADAEKRRAELAELAEAKLTLEGERSANDRRYRECNELLSQTQAAAGRLEQKRVTAAMEEKQILDKLWESYELSHSAAQEQRIELESVPKASRRINELKREINGLGNVNVGAIEEFDRVNTRYTYLTGQRDDVEKAKEELLGVIENITSEMTVIFKEQFALIRESFQETFLELFGGGKATLELEDENAVLDCGIEIKVQPPGKALKTLSLLSGGEKAFVAIALYFAILKVHPTPFCVMDEIEAALDEPNVIRVAHYMRRICDKTQFIVITHRRGTMEAADVLYGVTMQERGVSKVLTINMNDMAKELNIKG